MKHAERTSGATKRRWILAVIAIVAAAGTWSLARGVESFDSESWGRVERRDLVIGVDVEGELQAAKSADLGPPQVQRIWNFKISFLAPEGAEVAEGTPVLGFDVTELQQQLQAKVTERDSAIKQLEKRTTDVQIKRRDQLLELAEAEAELRRTDLQLKVPDDVAKRVELEQARIDNRLARLRIEHARTTLEHLQAQSQADLAELAKRRDRAAQRVVEIESYISQMTVKAPRAGTVIYKSDRGGEKKKVGDSVWRAGTVLQIPDLKSLLAEGEVAESDAGRLAEGQTVTLRLDAYPDREYRATVRKIRRTVQQKSWRKPQKIVRLVIELDETDTERMRPGMRFRGKIETGRVPETLVVPQEAVFSQPDGTAVFVRTLFGRRQVFPTFGQRNADFFGVESGLEEGDRVLLQGGGGSS